MGDELRYPLTPRTVHLCVNMQRVFSAEGPWTTPWMDRVLPVVSEMAGRYPERTVFTRFITPFRAEDMPGMWRRYYTRWREATRERLDPGLLELLPPLAGLCPPATVIDKTRYSGFAEPAVARTSSGAGSGWPHHQRIGNGCLRSGHLLGAVDLGYRVILVRDAVCSSSDAGHDALMQLYHQRYTEQIEVADAATILTLWR